MWKNNFLKAVTFSYDDGVLQDKRFVNILNKYGLKCTFNVNSGINRSNEPFYDHDVQVERFNLDELVPLYQGHEIALHSVTHPVLTNLQETEIYNEVAKDKINLENVFHTSMVGMAYPFGEYNDLVVSVVGQCGILYSRTVESNHSTSLQTDLLRYKPTCHHNDPEIFNIIDTFLISKPTEPQILYIWGHSYEFDVDRNWEHLEKICHKLSNRNDIFYGTNKEVLLDK